ncbi:hypothetical protein AA101099_1837 [Neoasaia chiangmaiensis NBRC 101099]|uniref:Uncharacterized protein n=1 Tax=Neoasaia chiangmaiensis TaxID=320497 RepID=A0A1U9KQZ5_9PROT|nr:DUF4174 domain-containing protein [Neoasaia chiangmaiensis]AQS88216.1 hypothetical protein A0U93_09980 [Neoasaia chiangmaiensis]GBR39831.1 hypothetical protein AA101099_1837 [Neoasaia chiangmaiensis NBRC 101099]GEN14761.1 hypothetical protein NCH01_11920 [Neoasaia chiangmaiensis]
MQRLVLVAIIAILFVVTRGCASGTLHDYQWHDRLLLVFASEENAALKEQARLVQADPDGLADRDMVVIAIIGERAAQFWRGTPHQISPAMVRNEYGVSRDTPFALRVIGKDGGTKWRSSKPTPLDEIYGIIDAMPMRRAGEH